MKCSKLYFLKYNFSKKRISKKEAHDVNFLFRCDPGEARTLDPMIKSHLLYQLSYGVIFLQMRCKGNAFFLSRKIIFNFLFPKF